MLNDIVSKKVDECMQPFVEKIYFLFDKLNLQTERSNQTQTDNSITIARLHEKNKFLKSEIQLKNEVIRLISNERMTMEERTNNTCETTVDNTNTIVTEKIHSRKINVTVVQWRAGHFLSEGPNENMELAPPLIFQICAPKCTSQGSISHPYRAKVHKRQKLY